jgi:ubiquinone/menaquinone biosynthesis C-methylase UbiE
LVAEGYADEADRVMAPFSLRALELAQLAPSARVLDVAAGPGTLSLPAAARVAHVTAVDFSEAMNASLRAHAERLGVRNLHVLQADGQALPFEPASFDAAFSMFGWMFFPDRPKGLSELRRVLRPGARLVVSSWAPVQRSPLMAAMFGALHAADPALPAAPVYDPDGLENPERLAAELRVAGFEDVVVHEHTLSVAYPDTAYLWHGMARSSAPLVAMRKRVGEATWSARSELAQQFLAEQLGPGAGSLSTTAWLALSRNGTR